MISLKKKEVIKDEVIKPHQENGIIENELIDMPNKEYHSHRDYISASQIKDLLKNPYLFFHPQPQEDKYVFNIGSAIHCLILEPHKFNDEFAVAPKCDKRTSKGKEDWNNFIEENKDKIILESDDFDNLIELQKSTLAIPEVVKLLKNGVSERSFFTTLQDGTKKKVRPDRLRDDNIIIDVKSCRDASPDVFKRDIATYKYYVQAAYYIDVLGAKEFIFLAIEKTPPYMVGIYVLTPEDLDRGRELIQKALTLSNQPEKYTKPLYTGKNGEVIQSLKLPAYIHYDDEN
jgi:exodeoxyribonuclease VIII